MFKMKDENWVTIVNDLVSYIGSQTCPHEETYRGGAIWEICHDCNAKWADDEGGKPDFVWPECVTNAWDMLDKLKSPNADEEKSMLTKTKTHYILALPLASGLHLFLNTEDSSSVELYTEYKDATSFITELGARGTLKNIVERWGDIYASCVVVSVKAETILTDLG